MPVVKEASSNNEFKIPEAGLELGILVKIIDVGTQEIEYQGQKKHKRQLYFGWELPHQTMDDGKPLLQGKFVNLAIGDKAALSTIAHSSTGVMPEIGFDPVTLIGKACNLTIAHTQKKDGSTGSKIANFAPLMKTQSVPKPVNEFVVFDLDKFDKDIFEGLSDGFKAMIQKSPEYYDAIHGKPVSDSYSYATEEIPVA